MREGGRASCCGETIVELGRVCVAANDVACIVPNAITPNASHTATQTQDNASQTATEPQAQASPLPQPTATTSTAEAIRRASNFLSKFAQFARASSSS